jgi:hypothetical protein
VPREPSLLPIPCQVKNHLEHHSTSLRQFPPNLHTFHNYNHTHESSTGSSTKICNIRSNNPPSFIVPCYLNLASRDSIQPLQTGSTHPIQTHNRVFLSKCLPRSHRHSHQRLPGKLQIVIRAVEEMEEGAGIGTLVSKALQSATRLPQARSGYWTVTNCATTTSCDKLSGFDLFMSLAKLSASAAT